MIWSDDCLACLCNMPHTLEEHNKAVELAAYELRMQREAMKREYVWLNEEYEDEE